MSTQKRLAIYERRLRRARHTIKDALLLAGLVESTYYRWKNGSRTAVRPRTWARFEKAVDKLAPPRVTTKPKPRAKPRPKLAREART